MKIKKKLVKEYLRRVKSTVKLSAVAVVRCSAGIRIWTEIPEN